MTPDDIAKLRALCEQATTGPWKTKAIAQLDDAPHGLVICAAESYEWGEQIADAYYNTPWSDKRSAQNAAFIAAARSALPALLAECEVLRRERDEARMACPCRSTTPCHDDCTCIAPLSSSGCRRCCTYGSQEQRAAKAERLATLTTTRDRLSARVAELERLLGEACDEFESAAASFADQGWPALSSEMRTRASRWRREGGIK